MRPMYETKDNLSKEAKIISEVELMWDCQAKKLPISYGLDYGIYRENTGSFSAFAEIKVRGENYPYSRMLKMGYMLSLNKWLKARQLYESTGIPFVLIIGLTDGTFYAKYGPLLLEHLPVNWGGRQDRGDWQDQEPVVILDFSTFKRLSS